jgi:hypothetical protein
MPACRHSTPLPTSRRPDGDEPYGWAFFTEKSNADTGRIDVVITVREKLHNHVKPYPTQTDSPLQNPFRPISRFRKV